MFTIPSTIDNLLTFVSGKSRLKTLIAIPRETPSRKRTRVRKVLAPRFLKDSWPGMRRQDFPRGIQIALLRVLIPRHGGRDEIKKFADISSRGGEYTFPEVWKYFHRVGEQQRRWQCWETSRKVERSRAWQRRRLARVFPTAVNVADRIPVCFHFARTDVSSYRRDPRYYAVQCMQIQMDGLKIHVISGVNGASNSNFWEGKESEIWIFARVKNLVPFLSDHWLHCRRVLKYIQGVPWPMHTCPICWFWLAKIIYDAW